MATFRSEATIRAQHEQVGNGCNGHVTDVMMMMMMMMNVKMTG
jgi:hypothetical protein